MNLFRLDGSIRTAGSVSTEVADTVEAAWRSEYPYSTVTRRNVGTAPLRPESWISAASGQRIPADKRTPEQAAAAALAAGLADELIGADAYVFAVPLYNFGVPQTVKAWMDMLFTDPRFAPGTTSPIAGRPAVLVVSRGGAYGPGTPRDGWDHSTPWLRRILADVFGLDLKIIEAELTLAGVNPAMAALRDLAEQSLHHAHRAAQAHGGELAQRVATPVA
ncbi:MAG TPA: NAD(P)H-dependent oxidoreductase [Micromonosporaceae bacterium]|nr:NAD(P)H-dependent oxidoreductase [Micromonosporaceae bacterium]